MARRTPRVVGSALNPHAEPFEYVFNGGEQQSGPLGPVRQPAPAYGSGTPGSGAPGGGGGAAPGTGRTQTTAGGTAGAPNPNRTSRTPGYAEHAYGSAGGFGGKAVQGTGFESKEARDTATAAANQPYGTESGPTYLEDRYLQRLYGNDPAFNYASKRGMEALGTRSAAAGGFNSGAARQQESDFMANLIAQSQGQLDALAGGATGARQNKIDSMYRTGLGLAGGQSGTNTAYDIKAGDAMSDALSALLGYTTGKAGVDDKSRQTGFNNILALYGVL